jgi:hypothetical protein
MNSHVNQGVTLETLPAHTYQLSYTCFLIPNDPGQLLDGVLADLLQTWTRTICLWNHWEFEFVMIRRHSYQWALAVNPTVATVQIVRQVRALTSQWIHENTTLHPGCADDFWAPGYLSLPGIHPGQDELIERYIQLIRTQ